MLTAPKMSVMLYRCTLCGRPQAKERPVCSKCYKSGKSLRGGRCPGCDMEHGIGKRNRVWCDECREKRLSEYAKQYSTRRKMAGIERYRAMKVAEKPVKGDVYAMTHKPITDEEFALKREKFRALLAADVHVGSCGHPARHHVAEREDVVGSWGTLAHQHMRGGVAGEGTDRTHTDRWTQNRGDRGR